MRNSIREMYQYIKKIAFNKKISLETLLPVIHCYARSPQVTPEKMIALLENIIKMLESGVDISCILEAGTFFGMSYDYIKFEQEKRIVSAERWKSEKIIEELEKMKSKLNGADKLLDIPFSMEIRDGIKTPSLIFNFDIKSLDGYYKSMYMDNKDFQIWCWNQLPESFKTIVTKLKRKKPFRKGKNFELLYQISLNSFEQEILDQLQAKMETLLPGSTTFAEEAYSGEDANIVSVHKAENGFVVETNVYGYADYIRMLTAVNNDGKVTGLVVLEAHETVGLGNEALTDHVFLSQFLNSSGSFAVATSGADAFSGATGEVTEVTGETVGVDALTGATVTSKAIVRAVNSAVAYVTGADVAATATTWGG